MIAVRLALLGAAVAAVAFFALGIRSVHNQNHVNHIVDTGKALGPAALAGAERSLAAARVLNPDEAPSELQAQIELIAGHPATAERIAKAVVRRAPHDVDAWVTLAVLTRTSDPATSRMAEQKIRDLAPPVKPAQ